jgi:hypothetical protein
MAACMYWHGMPQGCQYFCPILKHLMLHTTKHGADSTKLRSCILYLAGRRTGAGAASSRSPLVALAWLSSTEMKHCVLRQYLQKSGWEGLLHYPTSSVSSSTSVLRTLTGSMGITYRNYVQTRDINCTCTLFSLF